MLLTPYVYLPSTADHLLARDFEEQTIRLVRQYNDAGEYLSVHHQGEPDAPDATGLMLLAAATGLGGIRAILRGAYDGCHSELVR